MEKRVIWLVVSCLTVLSLLLAACAPAAVEEKKPPAEVAPKVEVPKAGEVAPEKVAPVAETPKYGGVITIVRATDVRGFDQSYGPIGWDLAQGIAYETLLVGDWAKGAAGSGETDWSLAGWAPEGFMRMTGAIAESWEVPDNQTLIFKIRKGVYWHNKPPVSGREVDANDVAFSMNYMYLNPQNPSTYYTITAPGGKKLLSATAPDKWTVVIKVEANAIVYLEEVGGRAVWIIPHESIEKYGDLKDWRNSLGTGPFMLTDYVAGSSLTFVRNPNYWLKDPIGAGKGNQLPYLDGVQALIIPDKSTRLAAFRTGKIDIQTTLDGTTDLVGEDIESLIKYNPAIKYKQIYGWNKGMTIKSTSKDPLAAPLMKQRVRYALQMAIDRESILRDFYKGYGHIWVVSFWPNSPYYIPLEKFPEHLRKVFTYNHAEAKKILAEEGYPNGFKTQLLLTTADVDLFSIVKDYWAKIGVDLELDAKEATVYTARWSQHNFPAMFASNQSNIPALAEKWILVGPGDPTKPPTVSNAAEISHPKLDDIIRRTNAVYGDYAARAKVIQEGELWLMDKLWWIQLVAPAGYIVWQPWLKNYHGEEAVGYRNKDNYVTWVWLDQELKKARLRR